jgi:F-type H+-transporting ATPase subunit c
MQKLAKIAFWALSIVMASPLAAFAEQAADAAVATGLPYMGFAIGGGIAVGFAGLGCGIGQGLTAGNTTAGIARNPGAATAMNTPFILGMVLIESIAIYGLLVGLLLWLKLP